MRVLCSSAALLLVLAHGAKIVAQPSQEQEPVRSFDDPCGFELVYRAPPGCPARRDVEREIYASTGAGGKTGPESAPGTPTADRNRCIQAAVRMDVAPGGRSARVEIRDARGHEVSREVTGTDCGEVVRAMTLIAGMSLVGQMPDEASSNTEANSALPATEGPTAPAHRETRPQRPAPMAGGAVPGLATPRLAEAATPWQWLFGVRGFVTKGALPHVALGAAGVVGMQSQTHTLLAPRVRFAVGRTWRQIAHGSGGDAVFSLTLAQVEACPVRWPPAAAWAVRPGAYLEVGDLQAEGQDVDPSRPQSASVFWGAAGVTLAAEVVLFGPLSLEAEGGVLFPWLRDSFSLEGQKLYEIPWAGWSGAVTLSSIFAGS